MDAKHRDALLVACSFAKGFLNAAVGELTGQPSDDHERAGLQLMAALNGIDHPEQEPKPLVEMCQCHHDHFQHHGTNGGPCMVAGCECKGFVAVAQ